MKSPEKPQKPARPPRPSRGAKSGPAAPAMPLPGAFDVEPPEARQAIEDEGCGRLVETPQPAAPPDLEPLSEELLPFGPPREAEAEEHDEPAHVEPANDTEESAATDAAGPRWKHLPSAAARILSRIGNETAVHVATGIPTLDTNTRGGLIAGRLTIIGGAPDAGKTSLGVQIAHERARDGYAVAIHCQDEDAEGILFRVGQQIGIRLEDLEAYSKEALSRLASHLESLPWLVVVDPDEDQMAIEDTAEALIHAARQYKARGMILVVDSVQTARARATEAAPSIREKISATTAALKKIAKRHGALVIATCELSRAAYRSRNAKDRIEDMAAFKESGAVEYAMNTGLVLRPVPDSEDEIEISVPKNKRGRRDPFRLRRDPVTCSYFEVPMPPEGEAEGERLHDLEARIVAFVRANPGTTKNAVRGDLKANAQKVSSAIDRLLERGDLRREEGPRNAVRLFPAGDEARSGAAA